ncbi:MAG TPA: hypothetical protein VET66_12745, partial [Steroidobacteraceae bacterium]|nr:hypothetical protein [Steroidobacteraceae bacterium]
MTQALTRRAFLGAAAAASAAAFARWDSRPYLVLYNGAILTMSTREPQVQALAVSGARVLAVGTSEQMLALAAPGTRRVDLGGQ